VRSWFKDEEHTYIIGAGTAGSNDKLENDGIYMGHAYSVLGVAFPEVRGWPGLAWPAAGLQARLAWS
jgi:hypothetical protein